MWAASGWAGYGKISNGIVTVAIVWVVGTPTGTGSDSAGHGQADQEPQGDAACVREIGLLGQRNGTALSAGLR